MTQNSLLEATLGLFWRLWGPCRCPKCPNAKKGPKKIGSGISWESLFGTFLLTFPIFVLFGTCFLRVFVFTPFGHSICTVLGTILRGFLCLISKAFQVKHGNEKCSLDSLFTIYEAHCLSVQKAKKKKKHKKMKISCGTLKNTLFDTILAAFRASLECLRDHFAKKNAPKGVTKIMPKKHA